MARELTGDDASAALSLVLMVLARPIAGTATVTVEALLLPRTVGLPLGLLALLLALRSRPRLAGAGLGVLLLVHPPTALPFLAAVLGRHLVRRQWRDAIGCSIAAAVIGSPALLRYAAGRSAAAAMEGSLGDAEWWGLAREHASFAFVTLWPRDAWLLALAPILREDASFRVHGRLASR